MASRDWREATKYEAQPVSSWRNCLKYMLLASPLGEIVAPDIARAIVVST
jgi:hypothetical protein